LKEILKTQKQFLSRWRATNSPVEIIGFNVPCVFIFCTFSSLFRDVEFPEPSLNCARHLAGLHNTKASKCGTIRLSAYLEIVCGEVYLEVLFIILFVPSPRSLSQEEILIKYKQQELHPIRPRRPTNIFTSAY
jgi:hypothetical protein